MEAVLVTPYMTTHIDLGDDLLKGLQKRVDGWIEIVRPRGLEKPYVMVVNEEGHLLDLPFNPVASALYGECIVGNAVILAEGYVNGEPDLIPLDEQQAEAIIRQIARMI